MDIEAVTCVCFSPTGSTKTIAEAVAKGMGVGKVNMIDLTVQSRRLQQPLTFGKEVVVLAAPVYYGRIPEEAAACFSALVGQKTPVVVVVVYGNRAFDDALIELRDIAVGQNFVPVAGGAFLAEHSYSTPAYPIAPGRPDDSDLGKATEFGTAVRDKLLRARSVDDVAELAVPGHVPYVELTTLAMIRHVRATTPLSFAPETDMNQCTQCGLCMELCPTGAISPDDVTKTDKLCCIICFACVKQCPEGARQMKIPQFEAAVQGISKACPDRKEPEVFL